MKIFRKKDNEFSGVIFGLQGEYKDAIIRLYRDELISVGRDPKTSHIVFSESNVHVSRNHCTIRCNGLDDTYTVCDHSSNGTFVNGTRLEHDTDVVVPSGSVIAIGDMENTFRLG